jgi:hypothetical protein
MVLVDASRRNGHVVVGDTVNEPSPPTLDMVLSLKKDYQTYYRAFHKGCRDAETYYFGENVVPVPVDLSIDPVRPATANSIINVATDHVDITNPAIMVPDPSPRSKDRAERIQKFLQGVWLHVPARVKRTAVRQQFMYGISFLKQMWEPDVWPDQPKMSDYSTTEDYRAALKDFINNRGIVFPFRVINANPKNLIWDDSRVGIKWVIESYQGRAGDLKRLYPEWVSSKGDGDVSSYDEYWDDTWHIRLIDNQIVWGPHEHGYGFMPYTPVVPGTSVDFDIDRPERRYRSMLAPVYNLLDTEARLVTQYEAMLRQYAWRTLDFHGNQTAAQNTADTYELFASKNIVPPGVDVVPSPTAVPPQEILVQLSNIQTMIEMATFPNVVRGVRAKGVSSGFHTSVLAGTGRLVFGPYAEGMSDAMVRLNRGFLMLIENKAQGKVTVRARSMVHNFDQAIGPDDIRGFYENVVVLKAEAPEEREREAILAFRLWNGGNGIISLYEAMRRSGIVNPLEEFNQLMAEQLVKGMFPQQLEEAIRSLNLGGQLAGAAGDTGPGLGGGGGGAIGNQFLPGQSQLQRPGEANIQQARVASQQGQPSVFPQGRSGMDLLGAALTSAPGTARGMPSGQVVR